MDTEGQRKVGIHENERLEIMDAKNSVTIVEGPCIISIAKSKVKRLRRFLMNSPTYIVVQYGDGRIFHIKHDSTAHSKALDGTFIFLKEGEVEHSVRCQDEVLNLEPEGQISYMKRANGNFVKYTAIPKDRMNLPTHSIPRGSPKTDKTLSSTMADRIGLESPTTVSVMDIQSPCLNFTPSDGRQATAPSRFIESNMPALDQPQVTPPPASSSSSWNPMLNYYRDVAFQAVRSAGLGIGLFDEEMDESDSSSSHVSDDCPMEMDGNQYTENSTNESGAPFPAGGTTDLPHKYSSGLPMKKMILQRHLHMNKQPNVAHPWKYYSEVGRARLDEEEERQKRSRTSTR
mmetsp:Transcript_5583/g.5771  ORF Transcript_5583/g.5771 Transcript_5583/m.5771 type:complete len:345 (+) Transcript_5583:114-1148(+)|eukprot:CAMPEP_0182427504 /NCGR_PEP_ID=MMETSP1167-20130531/17943_1 /TAXON_ID=2988 /ORGANISM="Mallomonas Sp, Strain CCMP3275" /LENGTH=344 /DNA_ID=CAMNT_0024609793 /DNA_START=74 /DNA_END=1108 /DNA_ORIENTATION=+